MAMEILAVICLLFLLLVIHHWRKRRNDAVLTNWPVFGVMPGLVKNIQSLHDFATEVLKSSGGTKAIKGPWFSNFDFWVTCDPTNMRHILNTNIANYPKGPEFQKMFEPFGYGIINSESHLWKNQRKMLLSIIGHSKFESYMEKTFERKVVHGLIPLLDHVSKARIEVDFQDVFQRLTFDSISILVLGTDPLSLSIDFPNVAYKNAFDDVEEMIFSRHFKPETLWKLQRWLQIGGEKKLAKSLKVFDEFIYQSIATKRQELINRSRIIENKDVEEANTMDDIVTSYMKQLKENQGQMLLGCYADSDKFLRDTSLNLMVAGRDTVASALTWFFWLVSTHPFVETKIVAEIREKLAENHDKDSRSIITKEVINKLVYLHATLCETLRLYPPIPINQRASSNADTLPSGHHLKKNQRILLYFYSMGRMEEIWGEDCLEFKPERWVSCDGGERRLVYVPSYKFTAYNAGPQACVGKGMSFTEMKMVAANILWNYRVEVVEGHPVSPSLSIVLYMKYGLKVMISPRCGCSNE